jgi:predicted ATP-grasp superfamily ATP-dependent carboligase
MRLGGSEEGRALSRILVTDGEQRSTLAIVRSLGRAGHHVEVCGVAQDSLAAASLYATNSVRVADPRHAPAAYRDAVAGLVVGRAIDVLIPTTDASVALLSDLPDCFPSLIVPHSGRPVYEALSDKRGLTEAASALGIAVPDQAVIESPHEVNVPSIEEIGYPMVLKPSRSSVATAAGVIKQGVRVVSSVAEREAAMREFPPEAYPLLAQRRIVGPGKGVFVLTWNGRVYAAFGHRRIREKPPTGGVSVYRESVRVPADVLDQARKILGHFGWNGVAMVEFKEDRETGTLYLMEVNARFWGSLQLAIDAGVDFPRLLVELATGREVEPVLSYRTGIRSRWFWGEVDHLIACLRTGHSVRGALPDFPGRVRTLLRFLVPWLPGDRYEVLRFTDARPFLRESIQWFRALGGSARNPPARNHS